MKGISVAGNLLVDHVKRIDAYPSRGMLSNIVGVGKCVGGCVPNTAVVIKRLSPSLEVWAHGRVGQDSDGDYILDVLTSEGVDTAKIRASNLNTSFTDAFIDEGGERTFFHSRGANAEFCPNDIDVNSLSCDIFHIGYLLLLDQFDKTGVMGDFLRSVRERGIKTSIDVVSDMSGRFKDVVLPCLSHCDYVIINEIEAGMVADISPRNADGDIAIEAIKDILSTFIACGVKDRVIVHCPEAAFCMDTDRSFTVVGSLVLPKGYIVSSVGAGDAFCAGALVGLHNGYASWQVLELASACAATSLAGDTPFNAVSMDRVAELSKFKRREIL